MSKKRLDDLLPVELRELYMREPTVHACADLAVAAGRTREAMLIHMVQELGRETAAYRRECESLVRAGTH